MLRIHRRSQTGDAQRKVRPKPALPRHPPTTELPVPTPEKHRAIEKAATALLTGVAASPLVLGAGLQMGPAQFVSCPPPSLSSNTIVLDDVPTDAVGGTSVVSFRELTQTGGCLSEIPSVAPHAQVSLAALVNQFGVPGQPGRYAEYVGERWFGGTVWPLSQVIAGALDVAHLTGDDAMAKAAFENLENFELNGAYAGGRTFVAGSPRDYIISAGTHIAQTLGLNTVPQRYYDDNAWLGLDFMQAAEQTPDPVLREEYIAKAEKIFTFLEEGIHQNGGVIWVEGGFTRNTCSTGPTLQLALRLSMALQKTNPPQAKRYFEVAQQLDQFLHLRLQSHGGEDQYLFWDHVNPDNSPSKDIWSYNQGTPIGADVLFARMAKDQATRDFYLDRAEKTAEASLKYFSQNDRLWQQPPAFNAIFFRNLLALDTMKPNPAYRETMEAYLTRAWDQGRDPQTGLFGQNGMGMYDAHNGPNPLDQGAMVQMYALLDWPVGDLHLVG